MKKDVKRFLRSELFVVFLLSSLGGEAGWDFCWVVLVLIGWFWGWDMLKRGGREMMRIWRRWADFKIREQHLFDFLSHPRGGRWWRNWAGLRSPVGPAAQPGHTDVAREASFTLPMQDFVPILPSVKNGFYGVPLPEMKRELMANASLNWSFRAESGCISVSTLLSPVACGGLGKGPMDSGGGDFTHPVGRGTSTAAGKILLVEDIEINRILLRKLLKDLNFLLEEAENGQIAVDYFKQGKSYDLVLMDKEMPVMDGHEATRQLRSLGVKTPIIALTGNSLQSDKDMFFQAGADEFQSKPLSRAELVRLLARYGLECPRHQ